LAGRVLFTIVFLLVRRVLSLAVLLLRRNATARPFKWTETADQIIDHICRYFTRISGPGY